MDLESFRRSASAPQPAAGLSLAVQALWWDAKGDWDKAHECAQSQDDADGAWVHAYLHRKEGDLSNAAYWYGQARQPVATDSLPAEWDRIVSALLAYSP